MRCCTANMIERHIKGGQKTIAFFGFFSGQLLTSISRKRFRDIDVGSWPKKTTKKLKQSCSACLKSQGIKLDNLTTLNLTHLFHLWKHCFPCFKPTSDDNISKTVYPIYLKIKVQKVPTSHSSYINFQVNRKNFDDPLFKLFCQKKVPTITLEDNSTTP